MGVLGAAVGMGTAVPTSGTVVLTSIAGSALHFAEVNLFENGGQSIALENPVMSSTLRALFISDRFPADLGVDGNALSFFHTARSGGTWSADFTVDSDSFPLRLELQNLNSDCCSANANGVTVHVDSELPSSGSIFTNGAASVVTTETKLDYVFTLTVDEADTGSALLLAGSAGGGVLLLLALTIFAVLRTRRRSVSVSSSSSSSAVAAAAPRANTSWNVAFAKAPTPPPTEPVLLKSSLRRFSTLSTLSSASSGSSSLSRSNRAPSRSSASNVVSAIASANMRAQRFSSAKAFLVVIDFDGEFDDELTCKKEQTLDAIGPVENAPDWWNCRDPVTGKTGIVPKSHLLWRV